MNTYAIEQMNDPFEILAGVKGAFSSTVKLLVALWSTLDHAVKRDKTAVYKIFKMLTLVRKKVYYLHCYSRSILQGDLDGTLILANLTRISLNKN